MTSLFETADSATAVVMTNDMGSYFSVLMRTSQGFVEINLYDDTEETRNFMIEALTNFKYNEEVNKLTCEVDSPLVQEAFDRINTYHDGLHFLNHDTLRALYFQTQ